MSARFIMKNPGSHIPCLSPENRSRVASYIKIFPIFDWLLLSPVSWYVPTTKRSFRSSKGQTSTQSALRSVEMLEWITYDPESLSPDIPRGFEVITGTRRWEKRKSRGHPSAGCRTEGRKMDIKLRWQSNNSRVGLESRKVDPAKV